MIIYKLENKINGKVYIGQTIVSLEKRLNGHKATAKTNRKYPLHKAIAKYGIENFEICIIDTAKDRIELSEKEKYWIKYYHAFGKGYNCTIGGEGSIGHKFSEESIQKMRDSHMGKYPTLEQRKKRSEKLKGHKGYWRGKKFSKETCKKRSLALKGKVAWNKGKSVPKGTRDKISKTLRNKEKCGRPKKLVKL